MSSAETSPLSADEPLSHVQSALEQAEQLRHERRYQEGIALLIEALQYGIEKAQIYYRLGNLYYDAAKLDHAEYAYRKVLTLDALHINAHHNLGVVYRRQGRIAESIKMRRLANKLARQHPERIQLGPDQVKHARGYARRMLLFGLLLTGALIVGLLLWLRFSGS